MLVMLVVLVDQIYLTRHGVRPRGCGVPGFQAAWMDREH